MVRFFVHGCIGVAFGFFMAWAGMSNLVIGCGAGHRMSTTVLAVAVSPAIVLLHPILFLLATPGFWLLAGVLLARAATRDEFGHRRGGWFVVVMLVHYAVALVAIALSGWDLNGRQSPTVILQVVIYGLANTALWMTYVRAMRANVAPPPAETDACPRCGYDMKGHESSAARRCPECGNTQSAPRLAFSGPLRQLLP